MATALTLTITQPAHGAVLLAPVALAGTAAGDTAGMFFKWFSSLNSAGTQAQPELNAAHGLAALNFAGPVLGEFGSHALVLAATDREPIDAAAIQAITRSAMTGGAPPAAPQPCVVHQLAGAVLRTPTADGAVLSKASATIEVLAPGNWVKPDAAVPGSWLANPDYQAINGVGLSLRFDPDGAPAGRPSATLALDLKALPFFRDVAKPGDPPASIKTWLRYTGPLPATLALGAHQLSLRATAGAQQGPAMTRKVVLNA